MTSDESRKHISSALNEAIDAGVRRHMACSLVGLSTRTLLRWDMNPDSGDKRPLCIKQSEKAFSEEEKDAIVRVCTSDEYKDLTPNEIVPILAENGHYYGSESTMYRVLKERALLNHRSDCKPPSPRKAPEKLCATGPGQVLSWDITYMKTKVRGIFYYLYLFMDVYSRKIVGWAVETNEDGKIAADIITEICKNHGLSGIRLHSDNGGPMKCGTMLAMLQWLGVVPSFSRPGVSNDNPFSESLFKTMKYRPGYPSEFASIEEAREWVTRFVAWYNTEHRHSAIRYVTPDQRHYGHDDAILAVRTETYRQAKLRRPDRWSGATRNWNPIKEVMLNGKTEEVKVLKCA